MIGPLRGPCFYTRVPHATQTYRPARRGATTIQGRWPCAGLRLVLTPVTQLSPNLQHILETDNDKLCHGKAAGLVATFSTVPLSQQPIEVVEDHGKAVGLDLN